MPFGPGAAPPGVVVDAAAPPRPAAAPRIPRLLFIGLVVAATGGPLALAALYVPGVLGDASGSAGLVGLLGVLFFLPPLLVWLRYSRTVVGPAGLTGFVEAAAGRGVARVHAGLWVLSYLLYLVYTVTYVAYDLLPAMFPRLVDARPALQVATAVVIAAVALLPVRACLAVLSVVAAGQVVLTVLLATTGFATLSGTGNGFGAGDDRGAVLLAAGNTSVLFVCASLPLFLGGEVRGGSVAVRRGLAGGWAVAAVVTVAAVVPLAAAAPALLGAEVPGMALATAGGRPGLATAVGVGVAASVVALVVAEFLALSRLGSTLTPWSVSRLARGLAAVLVVGAVASLADPDRVYDDLLRPSLVALWLAQVLVLAVYPRYAARTEPARTPSRRVGDVALAAAGSALMIFGLWSTIVHQIAT